MVNYQQGKIYKIVCNVTGLIYVGSTCENTLVGRLRGHRTDFKRFLEDPIHHLCLPIFLVLFNRDFNIYLLENYPCDSKDELLDIEQFYKDNIDCVNNYIL